jgi:hypothetical protein
VDLWWERKDGSIGRVQFDAWIRSDHESSGELTDRAVERGADIADHYRPGLDRVSWEAEVTNTPITVPETQMDGVAGAVDTATFEVASITMLRGATGGQPAEWARRSQQVGAQVLRFERAFDRPRAVYEELRALVAEGTRIHIVTKLRDYEDMVILRLSSPEEARGAVTFTFEARQILTAETKTVEAPLPWRSRSRGVQPAEEETDAARATDARERGSVLSEFFGGLFE